MDNLECVNPLQGTDSRYEFSTGNTSPLVGVPRGMTYWMPQTSDDRFAFDLSAHKLAGFRATHAPSPWMRDYGHFDVMPVTGDLARTPAGRASAYQRAEQHARPNRYGTRLLRYGIDVELTATDRCGMLRCLFPPDAGERAGLVVQGGQSRDNSNALMMVRRQRQTVQVFGLAQANNGGVPDNFGCYFVMQIDGADVLDWAMFDLEQVHGAIESLSAPRAGVYLRLRPSSAVTVRLCTSFISHEQALLNQQREMNGQGFDEVATQTGERWRNWLGSLEAVGGDERSRRCFYSALYRVGLFPTAMHEVDATDQFHHYSPYDGRIHKGALYTNNGFWDTHRTVYPLLAMIDPQGFGKIVEGFLQAYRQGGWLPKWASPGYQNCMIGTHADAVIAEAICHNITGFDYEEAYQAVRRNAFEAGDPHGRFGRMGLNEYIKHGYVPHETADYSVSRTLDYAYSDWCIAQVAERLGHHEDASTLKQRALNYRNLWHERSGFMRPRSGDGQWVEPWNEFEWGGAYVEGGPWQHSFNVPHDVEGLARLHGGRERLVQRLEQMLKTPPTFTVGTYGFEIHEMTEMALAKDRTGEHFGQYAHSNQPVHGYLWMFAALGRPDLAARHVRRVMEALYTPNHLPGDEDNGEMSAWYIFAAMGRYPLCPGSGQLIEADPGVFDKIVVRGNE